MYENHKLVMEARSKMESSAAEIASQTVVAERPEQWGLLTAMSPAAKERIQGQDIVLFRKEHVFGRLVPDRNFKFEPSNVSGKHCKMFLKTEKNEDGKEAVVVHVQDSSSNGTYIQGHRLEKNGKPMPLRQGDILSLVGPPESDAAFAYVFRTVKSEEPAMTSEQAPTTNRQPAAKRKPSPPASDMAPFSEQPSESKRPRGAESVVRLDDVKRLQRSNEELRTSLEDQVRATEKAKLALRSAKEDFQEERGKLEAAWKAKLEQAQAQSKEQAAAAEASKAAHAQQQSAIEDLQQRLTAADHSREEAEEAIKKNLTIIKELEHSLEEQRKARASERVQADADQKLAVEKARAHALEELARKMEGAAREQEDQARRLQALQEADKENRAQNETLRAKLEQERRLLVDAQEQARRLQARVEEERTGVMAMQAQLEQEGSELREKERALQEERAQRAQADLAARAHAAALEEKLLELAMERQRLQGLRERILVRETQLRAFHSTTAEISPLFAKMQQQLATMMSVSTLASEETRSGGAGDEGNSPPRNEENEEGAQSAREKSPPRDVNMTQLEEEDDVVMSTAPVLRTTPRKTPQKIVSPFQQRSATRMGVVSRALRFEEDERREEDGVFAKPADRTSAEMDVRATLKAADEGVEEGTRNGDEGSGKENGMEEEERNGGENKNDEQDENNRDIENFREDENNEGAEDKEEEEGTGVEKENRDEGNGREEPGGGETMMMEDDAMATMPATCAGETLLMDEQGGGFGSAKSAPLMGIPEEDFDAMDNREDANTLTQIEGAKEDVNALTQIEGGIEDLERGSQTPESEEEKRDGEEEELEKKGGAEDGVKSGAGFIPQRNSINDTPLVREKDLENGQPPDSVQLSGLPDDVLKREASFGDDDISASKARRQSFRQKMDALTDLDFTEKQIAASPREQGSQEPDPQVSAASAPPGLRLTAGSRSPTAVKTLFRRRSFGSEPQLKRFKGDEIVQDSGSQQKMPFRETALDGFESEQRVPFKETAVESEQKVPFEDTALDGTPCDSVARKRGGSSEENDDFSGQCPKDMVSSQRSASGNKLPSRNVDGFVEPPPGFPDTQASENDSPGDLPDSLAGLQCSEALTSANLEMTPGGIEMTPAAMPQPTRPPPAPKTRTPRHVVRTGQGRFDPDAMAGLDTEGPSERHVGESLQSDGRVGESEEEESEDLENEMMESEPVSSAGAHGEALRLMNGLQSNSPAFST